MTDLNSRLLEVARAPMLLVGCDLDGTLAPIQADFATVRPEADAVAALQALAGMPRTHVAVISGRTRRDLAALLGSPAGVTLVGEHGAEWEDGGVLDETSGALLLRVIAELDRISAATPGSVVERKATGAAFHFRRATTEDAVRAVAEVERGPGSWPGVWSRPGKMVLELSVVEGGKGRAVEALRKRTGADAVVFIGDDVTDEEAFASLRPPDLGVKVGPGSTVAEHRIAGEAEAAVLLGRLIGLRAAPAQAAPSVPIEQHALLSDQRTVALVTPRGRVTWLCLPRIDSPAIMADLVGGRGAGYFEVSGIGGATPVQRYEGDSFVLRTQWGGLSVVDYLDCSGGRPYQRAGRSDLIRVVEGQGPYRVVFAPRVDFGRVATRLVVGPDGVEVEGAVDPVVLRAPGLAWRIVGDGHHQTAVAHGRVQPGQPMVLELRYGTRNFAPSILAEAGRREQSVRFWSNWAGSLRVPPVHADLVRRSALVIKSLSHGPTGAIAAAATTSLPETIGGVRNWDYRFCWPRDAALAASAMIRLGNTGLAMRLLDWLVGVVSRLESPDRLRPIYTVNGSELGPEAEIGELAGYEGSRPVRVGNGAAQQVQLDVFGPITELVAMLLESGAPLTPDYWRLVQAMAAAVEARWEEPDHGIWEIRGPRRHHTHTKVMCWQTMDRAIMVAGQHMGRVPEGWVTLRDRIAADVLNKGVDAAGARWCGAYGDPSPDASVLHVCLSGLVKPDDPRFEWAVNTVERDLLEGATVLRYKMDDGLPGREGGFHICAGWLAECYAIQGRREKAEAMLDGICSLSGPLGLLSEQHDPATGRALGNHAQAYSHLAIINACVRLGGASAADAGA